MQSLVLPRIFSKRLQPKLFSTGSGIKFPQKLRHNSQIAPFTFHGFPFPLRLSDTPFLPSSPCEDPAYKQRSPVSSSLRRTSGILESEMWVQAFFLSFAMVRLSGGNVRPMIDWRLSEWHPHISASLNSIRWPYPAEVQLSRHHDLPEAFLSCKTV